MIVLNLTCGIGHCFEAWFASAEAFDEQVAGGLVCCPQCQDTAVARLPSAPHVRRGQPQPVAATAPEQAMREALERLAREAEDVGQRFPEEARRIHYEEVPARSIRGQASVADTLELLDEGIAVLPLPVPGSKSRH